MEVQMKTSIEQVEVEIIGKYVRGKILDLGCGEGRLYPLLSKKGDYQGVDIDLEYITTAKINFPEGWFEVADTDSLDFKNEVFDIVFCGFNVIDEIEDRSLSEVYRVLKTGGLFIFSYHNILNPLNLRDCLRGYIIMRAGKKIKVKFRALTKIKKDIPSFHFIKKYGGLFGLYPYCIFRK